MEVVLGTRRWKSRGPVSVLRGEINLCNAKKPWSTRTKNVGCFPVYCAEGGSRKQIGAMEWKGSDELYLAGKARVSTFRLNYNPSHHQVWPRWWGVLWRQLSAGVRGSDCDVTGRVVKNTDLVQRSKECTRHQAKENDSESVMRQNMLLGFLPGLAGSMLFLWCLCGSD